METNETPQTMWHTLFAVKSTKKGFGMKPRPYWYGSSFATLAEANAWLREQAGYYKTRDRHGRHTHQVLAALVREGTDPKTLFAPELAAYTRVVAATKATNSATRRAQDVRRERRTGRMRASGGAGRW